MTKIIIDCAVMGSLYSPSMSPHLPATAAEIAKTEAAIGHLHARNRQDGRYRDLRSALARHV